MGDMPLSALERGQIQFRSSPPTPVDLTRYEATLLQAEEAVRAQTGELVRLRARVAELEAALRSHEVGNLRHLYSHMVNGRILDLERAARGLLAPAICTLETALAPDISNG